MEFVRETLLLAHVTVGLLCIAGLVWLAVDACREE